MGRLIWLLLQRLNTSGTSIFCVCLHFGLLKKHLSGHDHVSGACCRVCFVSEVEYYLFLADFGLLTFATVAMIVVIVRAVCANKSVGRTFVGKNLLTSFINMSPMGPGLILMIQLINLL